MRQTDAREQKKRILKMFTVGDLRRTFRERTDDEMFFQVGSLDLGPVRTAALQALGKSHLVVWHGYEYVAGISAAEAGKE